MTEPHWIESHHALAIHTEQLSEHGGQRGVRDGGLLESALNRPRNLWHYSDNALDLPAVAASYAFGMAKNHPFFDGNKRVSLVISFTFLALNGYRVLSTQDELAHVFEALAAGDLNEETLTVWFRNHAVAG